MQTPTARRQQHLHLPGEERRLKGRRNGPGYVVLQAVWAGGSARQDTGEPQGFLTSPLPAAGLRGLRRGASCRLGGSLPSPPPRAAGLSQPPATATHTGSGPRCPGSSTDRELTCTLWAEAGKGTQARKTGASVCVSAACKPQLCPPAPLPLDTARPQPWYPLDGFHRPEARALRVSRQRT